MSMNKNNNARVTKSSFLSLLLLPLCAGVAQADEPAIGFYAGGAAGRAILHRERLTRSGLEAHDTASKAYVGYRVYPGLAFEATYADYGDIKKDTRLAGNIDVFSVAAVGLIQLRQWDLFGKVGAGAWDGRTFNRSGREVQDNDIDPFIGIGAQFRVGRFALRVESEAQQLSFAAGEHGRDGDWINFISAGASWTF
jgi:hypothetical protein